MPDLPERMGSAPLDEPEPGGMELAASYSGYAGPLPPPGLLNEYDPETRQSIIAEFQGDSEHRRKIEQSALEGNLHLARRAQDRAAVIAVGGIVLSIVLVGSGEVGWGVAFGAVELLLAILATLVNRFRRSN